MDVNGNWKSRLFRMPVYHSPFVVRLVKSLILAGKCVIIAVAPLAVAWPIARFIWLPFYYKQGRFIPADFEVSYTAAVIPTLGIFFVIIATVMLAPAWSEYKKMRLAVKVGDEYTFQLYRKENVSPLIHTLIFALSVVLLRAFMNLHYPSAEFGMDTVGGVAYLLILYFLVLVEVDNPCSGLWFIADIPKDWLKRDCNQYLAQMREENVRARRFPTCDFTFKVEIEE